MKYVLPLIVLILMSATVYAEPSLLRITMLSQSPDPVQPGDIVELRFRVENIGAPSDAYTYELLTDYPFSVEGTPERHVGSLDGYQRGADGATLYWRVRVDPGAVEQETQIVRIRYYPRGQPDRAVTTEPFPVRIRDTAGLLAVTSSTITPEQARPAQMLDLEITLENLASAPMDNVRVSLLTAETPFTATGGSSERVIRRLGAGAQGNAGFSLFVAPDAEHTVHALPIEIRYEDRFGEQHMLESQIGIQVNSPSSYIVNLEDTRLHLAGTRGNVIVSISNTGTSTMRFVSLTLEESDEYEVVGSRSTYLGNLASDDFETGQFSVYASTDARDVLPLRFTLTYTDAYGNVHRDEIVVENRIYTYDRAQELGIVDRQGTRGLLVLAALLVIGGYWLYRRRRGSLRSLR